MTDFTDSSLKCTDFSKLCKDWGIDEDCLELCIQNMETGELVEDSAGNILSFDSPKAVIKATTELNLNDTFFNPDFVLFRNMCRKYKSVWLGKGDKDAYSKRNM